MRTTFTATCAECPWTGTTDRAAEKHTREAGHATCTHIVPDEGGKG